MSLSMMRGVRFSLLLAALGTIIAPGANAQTTRPATLPPGAVVQPLVPDSGTELRRHLMTLAENPRSLDALIGAGRAALEGGDTQAALTFFSRAAEVAPRDSRVKAGMASVLVRMERGQPALNLFAEAVALGAPVLEIAGDRGLAHDIVGDPRRAQQDYALLLQRREDPEVRRRLALSLAISGEREAALRAIDGQLRRNDRAAWRTQAFVLALTGDPAGANRTAQGLMPPASAAAMAPFFARLASLTPAQKAMAAHFGRFPSNGRIATAGGPDIQADPGALALATGAQPVRLRTQPSDPASDVTRRRPGAGQGRTSRNQTRARNADSSQSSANSDASGRLPVTAAEAGTRSGAADSRRGSASARSPSRAPVVTVVPFQPQSPPATAVATSPSSEPMAATTQPAIAQSSVQPGRANPASGAAVNEGPLRPIALVPTTPTESAAAVDLPRQMPPPAVIAPQSSASAERPARPSDAARSAGLTDIAAVVATLPEDEARTTREPSASRSAPATTPARSTPRASPPAARPAASRARPAHPSRHWVQIAGGANAAALPRELARLRGQAPELANRNAWVTPANATNRLLIGPFAGPAEAQEFVNGLARRNIAAFVWTSPAGQEIARLQPGR